MANEQNLIPAAHKLTLDEQSAGCAAGRRKTAHGYKWKYKGVEWRYEYDGRP